jgi:hypothetical protein
MKTIKFEELEVDEIIDGEKTQTCISEYKSYKKGDILQLISVLEDEETETGWYIEIMDIKNCVVNPHMNICYFEIL